jgi:uncharacterized membrane protein YraQ (UPF0718 family)
MKIIKRYRIFIIMLFINIALLIAYPTVGRSSFSITYKNLIEMLLIIPPIFILLGLLDVWVPKEIMMKVMGEKSGFKGILIAFLLGSAAAGPLYAAFPVAGVLLKKGSKLSNIFIFIGAWSTTKIPLLLFEATSMGWKFTIYRLLINLFGIAFLAWSTEKVLSNEDKTILYQV